MFKKHYSRKSANPIFLLFRLILSLTMFALLLAGGYSAYKHFSGLDPLKLDPQQVLSEVLKGKIPPSLLSSVSSIKVGSKILGQSKEAVIPADSNQDKKSDSSSFKFLLIADSHSDSTNLSKAIVQAKEANPDLKFIIGLGDYTNVGTTGELTAAKNVLDSSGLRYFLVPGDHDLWDSRNRNLDPVSDFKSVFGPDYQSFTFRNFEFLLIDNSDDYSGISGNQQSWIDSELEKIKTNKVKGIFVFLHEPLYHPSSDHDMGKTNKELKTQASSLIYQFKQAGVLKIFAGDIHYFSEYEEPVTKLPMVTVGAITSERNPQSPRYAVVTVYDNGNTQVDDTPIK